MQARQARLALLRDFERTTLTLANFCALKGLTPEALTPLLDAARQEAAEAPPPRPLDDRRGPPGAGRGEHPNDRPNTRPNTGQDARPNDRPGTRGPGRLNDRPNERGPGRPGGRPTHR